MSYIGFRIVFSIFLCQQIQPLLLANGNPNAPIMLHKIQMNKSREILRYAKAADMRNYMNESAAPCEDFYTYACGNWGRINPATATWKTGIFDVLAKAYDRKAGNLLNAAKVSSESNTERQVKYFYESCLDHEALRRNYREKLLAIIEEFGGMPALKEEQWKVKDFDWLEVVALILRKYGKQIIIGVSIAADLSNNEVNRLYIGQPDEVKVSSRSSEYFWLLAVQYMSEMEQVLGMSTGVARTTALRITDFQKKLSDGMSDPLAGFGMEDKTVKRTLESMSELYQPSLNYTRFIQTWLGYDYNQPVYEYVESYQQNLKTIIDSTPKSVVADYIMWHLLQDFRLEAAETLEKQKEKCVTATKRYFLKYLDNMVYRDLLKRNQNINQDVEQLWQELKQSYAEMLNSTDWLSEKTRDMALEKLSAMTMVINSYENEDFDKQYGDLVIGTDDYFNNVINILEQRGRNYRARLPEPPKLEEAELLNYTPGYTPEFNRVLMPVAFLQRYFLWDPAYPMALKYATAGYTLAHEMTHGFDDTVRKYDAKGNLNNWWDRDSSDEFVTRKHCLRQQFSTYKFAGSLLPDSNAQDENIADNVGIRVAYAAYEKWLEAAAAHPQLLQQESLPHLDLTPQQLFFLSLAQVWCTDVHPTIRSYLTTIDVHAPEEVRVRAMVSNFDAFAEEFKCQSGAGMNPQRKCIIY